MGLSLPDGKPPLQWRRILVVPLRFVGDTVLSIPLIRAIKRQCPHATIDVLVSPAGAQLMETCPYVDSVIIEAESLVDRLNHFKQAQYDAVFSLRKSLTLPAMVKIANRQTVMVGYDKQRWPKPIGYKRAGIAIDAIAPYPPRRTILSMAKHHLALLLACGLTLNPEADAQLDLWTTPEDDATLATLLGETLADGKPIAVVHMGSATPTKNIPPERFTLALQGLKTAGYSIVAIGNATDEPPLNTVATMANVPLLNLAGKTTLRQVVALFANHTQLLLGVDSGPVHLAAAAGVPTIVALYGPTNPFQWGPQASVRRPQGPHFYPIMVPNLPCRPCHAQQCHSNACRTDLSAELIAQGLHQALAMLDNTSHATQQPESIPVSS
jgi:ADP-heptose:LPS heptosyltransferase